jgi:hypothetical protein
VEAGVQNFDRIRLLRVDQMPSPTEPGLQSVMQEAGVFVPHLPAMVFGYGICGPLGFTTSPNLAHVFRHVQQFEAAGSIADFVRVYFQQIIEFGHERAPYEVEARAYEGVRFRSPSSR